MSSLQSTSASIHVRICPRLTPVQEHKPRSGDRWNNKLSIADRFIPSIFWQDGCWVYHMIGDLQTPKLQGLWSTSTKSGVKGVSDRDRNWLMLFAKIWVCLEMGHTAYPKIVTLAAKAHVNWSCCLNAGCWISTCHGHVWLFHGATLSKSEIGNRMFPGSTWKMMIEKYWNVCAILHQRLD